MARLSIASAALLGWASLAAAATSTASGPESSPSTKAYVNQLTSQGCYGSLSETAKIQENVTFLSSGSCWEKCQEDDSYTVMILHQTSCYCATTYPPKDSVVDDSKCNYPCPGYVNEACGGKNYYNVFNTGEKQDVDNDKGSSTATATSSATSGSASSDSSASASGASKTPSTASGTAADSTQSTSTPSSTAAGESSGAIQKSSLVSVLAFLGVALAL